MVNRDMAHVAPARRARPEARADGIYEHLELDDKRWAARARVEPGRGDSTGDVDDPCTMASLQASVAGSLLPSCAFAIRSPRSFSAAALVVASRETRPAMSTPT